MSRTSPRTASTAGPWYYSSPLCRSASAQQSPGAGHAQTIRRRHPPSANLTLLRSRSPSTPARSFPPYQGDLFVASHGSWNKAVRGGYELLRVRLVNGVAYSRTLSPASSTPTAPSGAAPLNLRMHGCRRRNLFSRRRLRHHLANHLYWILMVECGRQSSRSLIGRLRTKKTRAFARRIWCWREDWPAGLRLLRFLRLWFGLRSIRVHLL